eukprot:scaffold13_cov241-Pinguiococcus_pyrenoidosus.AAC.43
MFSRALLFGGGVAVGAILTTLARRFFKKGERSSGASAGPSAEVLGLVHSRRHLEASSAVSPRVPHRADRRTMWRQEQLSGALQ